MAAPSNCRLTAIDASSTISTTANRSSTTKIPKSISANFCRRSPRSSSALNTMVVDDMHSIPPRNSELISDHPIVRPSKNPHPIIPTTIVRHPMNAVAPIFRSFLNENSSPSANSRKMTPISPHVSALSMFTHKLGHTYGPVRIPATIYPSTTGCLSHLHKRLMLPATSMMMPRSSIMVPFPPFSAAAKIPLPRPRCNPHFPTCRCMFFLQFFSVPRLHLVRFCAMIQRVHAKPGGQL